MAKWRMPKIVRQAGSFNDIYINATNRLYDVLIFLVVSCPNQNVDYGAPDLGDL